MAKTSRNTTRKTSRNPARKTSRSKAAKEIDAALAKEAEGVTLTEREVKILRDMRVEKRDSGQELTELEAQFLLNLEIQDALAKEIDGLELTERELLILRDLRIAKRDRGEALTTSERRFLMSLGVPYTSRPSLPSARATAAEDAPESEAEAKLRASLRHVPSEPKPDKYVEAALLAKPVSIRAGIDEFIPVPPSGASKKSRKRLLNEALWMIVTERDTIAEMTRQQDNAAKRLNYLLTQAVGTGEITVDEANETVNEFTQQIKAARLQLIQRRKQNSAQFQVWQQAAKEYVEDRLGQEQPMWFPRQTTGEKFSLEDREKALVAAGMAPAPQKAEDYQTLLELLRGHIPKSAENALLTRTQELRAKAAPPPELAEKTKAMLRTTELRQEAQEDLTAAQFELQFIREATPSPKTQLERLAYEADIRTAEARIKKLKDLVKKRNVREINAYNAVRTLQEEQKAAQRVLARVQVFAQQLFNKPIGDLTDEEIGIAISRLGPTRKAQADKFTRAARAIMETVDETDEYGNKVYVIDPDGNRVVKKTRDYVRDSEGNPLFIGASMRYTGKLYSGKLYRTDVINRVPFDPQLWNKLWRIEAQFERAVDGIKPAEDFARRVVDYQKYSKSEIKMSPEQAASKRNSARNAPRDLGVIQDMIQQYGFQLPASSNVFVPKDMAMRALGGRPLRIPDLEWEKTYKRRLPPPRSTESGRTEAQQRRASESEARIAWMNYMQDLRARAAAKAEADAAEEAAAKAARKKARSDDDE